MRHGFNGHPNGFQEAIACSVGAFGCPCTQDVATHQILFSILDKENRSRDFRAFASRNSRNSREIARVGLLVLRCVGRAVILLWFEKEGVRGDLILSAASVSMTHSMTNILTVRWRLVQLE